jgi:membrane protein
MKALMAGLNVAYDEQEKRTFLNQNLTAVVLTLAAVGGVLSMITLVALLPLVLKLIGVTNITEQTLSWLRWPTLLAVFMTGLACVYRFAPSRRAAKWNWVSWGAGAATALWMIGSAAFSLYVSKLGHYDKTYGSLGAVIVFLLWLYLSAYAVLVGAELNSEMERQTVKDTTVGEPKPLGQRGATAADTVGPAHHKALRDGPSPG